MKTQVRTGVCMTKTGAGTKQYWDFLDLVFQPEEQHETDAMNRAEWLGRKQWPIMYRDGTGRPVIRFRNEVK